MRREYAALLTVLALAPIFGSADQDGVHAYETHTQLHGAMSLIEEMIWGGSVGERSPATWLKGSDSDRNQVLRDFLGRETGQFVGGFTEAIKQRLGDLGVDPLIDGYFTLQADGDNDLGYPCIEAPSSDDVLSLLLQYLFDPVDARITGPDFKNLAWKPSEECLYKHSSLEIEGGVHAEVSVSCGDDLIVTAGVASAGVTERFYWTNAEAHGLSVSVNVLDGLITKTNTISDLSPSVDYSQSPLDGIHILIQVDEKVKECAAAQDLHIRGVIGGGWRQVFTEYGGDASKLKHFVVGYSDAFVLDFGAPSPVLPPEHFPSDWLPPFPTYWTEQPVDTGDTPPPLPPVELPTDPTPPLASDPTTPRPPPTDDTLAPAPPTDDTSSPASAMDNTTPPAPPTDGATAPPSAGAPSAGSPGDVVDPASPLAGAINTAKRLSELTTAVYFSAGQQCAEESFRNGCFSQHAFSHISDGKFSRLHVEIRKSSSTLFPMLWFAVVASVVVLAIGYRTKTRRTGYSRIPADDQVGVNH